MTNGGRGRIGRDPSPEYLRELEAAEARIAEQIEQKRNEVAHLQQARMQVRAAIVSCRASMGGPPAAGVTKSLLAYVDSLPPGSRISPDDVYAYGLDHGWASLNRDPRRGIMNRLNHLASQRLIEHRGQGRYFTWPSMGIPPGTSPDR